MRTLSLVLLATTLSVHAAPMFRNPLPVPIPTSSVSTILTADFDGDRHDDVLLVSPAKALVVYLDNGTGPFAAPVVTPITFATGDPGVGDVNRDGHVDVIVTDWSSRTARVMLGTGDGSFASGETFATGIVPVDAAVADFNGDALMDVAIITSDTHSSPSTIAVFFGDETGHFSSGATSSVDTDSWKLNVADMNRDGKADLVIESWSETTVVLGNGDGTFTYKTRTTDGGVAIADFNHDGVLDLAVAAGSTQDWFIQVSFGNGDGSLGPATRYVSGYDAGSIVAADIDADGQLDLLAAGTSGSTVTVLRGNANGTFRNAEYFLSGPSAWKILASDFDRDDKIDFLTLDYNSEIWSLSFVQGNGDGSFKAHRAFHTNGTVPVSWPGLRSRGGLAADMNNDGHMDVVVIQEHPGSNHGECDLAVLLNDGTGKLTAPILTLTASANRTIAVADVNRDGNDDVVVTHDRVDTAETFLGDGTGHFPTTVSSSNVSGSASTLADFDGDGNPDLLATPNGTFLHRGNGDGTFATGIPTTAPSDELFVGDLNGDGHVDFVTSDLRDTQAYLNDGTGHFTRLLVTNDEIRVGAVGDFNGDSKPDLLFTTYGGTQTRFGKGDGTFGASVSVEIKPVPNQYPSTGLVATADINRDGKLDIAFGSSVYLGNGDGTFRTGARFRTNNISTIAFADLDGDGSPDLLLQKEYADDVDVLLTYTNADPTERSSITLVSDTPAPQYARAVVFTATVAAETAPETGFITFSVDGMAKAIIAVVDGKATFSTAFTLGPHDVSATYGGDEVHLASTTTQSLSVAKATTTVSIQGGPNPQSKGLSVSVIVYLSAAGWYGLPAATGTLTLRDGATPLNVPITSGRAVVRTLDVGTHVISADYPGDANYEPSTASYTQTITKPVPFLILTATPAKPLVGNLVGLHAGFSGITSISGTISFSEGQTLLGVVPLNGGTATLEQSLAQGDHLITATYSGDDVWATTQRSIRVTVLDWAHAQIPAFRTTGSMAIARSNHVAVRLSSGNVLVTGGIASSALRRQAEVYDAAHGTFVATGEMSDPRLNPEMTLLQDGRVLVTGGISTELVTNVVRAEVYDAQAGTFAPSGNMGRHRANHSATLLPNGNVLIAGGQELGTALTSAELFDPATGTFSATGSGMVARYDHSAVLLPQGKVLLAGGRGGGSSAELYDPATGTFAVTGVMTASRANATATLLPSGKVLITGGFIGTTATPQASAELYDPVTGKFSATGGLVQPRAGHTATLLRSGKVLIVGGFTASQVQYSEVYDPATGTFTRGPDQKSRRREHTATLLMTGEVLLTGGTSDTTTLATAEIFDEMPGKRRAVGR